MLNVLIFNRKNENSARECAVLICSATTNSKTEAYWNKSSIIFHRTEVTYCSVVIDRTNIERIQPQLYAAGLALLIQGVSSIWGHIHWPGIGDPACSANTVLDRSSAAGGRTRWVAWHVCLFRRLPAPPAVHHGWRYTGPQSAPRNCAASGCASRSRRRWWCRVVSACSSWRQARCKCRSDPLRRLSEGWKR